MIKLTNVGLKSVSIKEDPRRHDVSILEITLVASMSRKKTGAVYEFIVDASHNSQFQAGFYTVDIKKPRSKGEG